MKAPNEYWIHGAGVGLLVMINITGNPIPENTDLAHGLLAWLAVTLIIIAQWSGIVWSVRRSWRLSPDLMSVRRRLTISFLSSIIWVTPLMVVSDFVILRLLQNAPFEITGGKIIGFLANAFILCFTVIGVAEAIYYFTRLRNSEKEKEELLRINLLTQYDSLKQQVNPHFLFNSLNSLSSLISIDPGKAEKFVEELSHVYRYLLQSNREELVSLDRELSFIRSYLHLLQTRFGDAFQVTLDVPEAFYPYKIPPLTLQLLVENAVKHNEISRENPLYISMAVHAEDRLKVVNNLQKKVVHIVSEKVGLANIIAKYRLLGQPEVEICETDGAFIVSLPLIKST